MSNKNMNPAFACKFYRADRQACYMMERNGIFGDYLSLRARVDAFGKKKSESSDSTERGARIIMEEAAVLLRRLSEHMEAEKVKKVKKMAEDQDSDDDRKRRTGREVGLGHVTLLDMGSYLLSLVVKLIEVEAQQQLKGLNNSLAQHRLWPPQTGKQN